MPWRGGNPTQQLHYRQVPDYLPRKVFSSLRVIPLLTPGCGQSPTATAWDLRGRTEGEGCRAGFPRETPAPGKAEIHREGSDPGSVPGEQPWGIKHKTKPVPLTPPQPFTSAASHKVQIKLCLKAKEDLPKDDLGRGQGHRGVKANAYKYIPHECTHTYTYEHTLGLLCSYPHPQFWLSNFPGQSWKQLCRGGH